MKVRKEHAGCSSHGYRWPRPGAVVEVDDEHAAELLAIPDGGFTEVPDDVEAVDDGGGAVHEAPAPRSGGGRRRRRATTPTAEVAE